MWGYLHNDLKYRRNTGGWWINCANMTYHNWGQEEKGTTEDEMAGWHHWLDWRESQWTPGVGDGQGGLACCDSWGRKESDTTERLIWSDLIWCFSKPPTYPTHRHKVNVILKRPLIKKYRTGALTVNSATDSWGILDRWFSLPAPSKLLVGPALSTSQDCFDVNVEHVCIRYLELHLPPILKSFVTLLY